MTNFDQHQEWTEERLKMQNALYYLTNRFNAAEPPNDEAMKYVRSARSNLEFVAFLYR